MTHNSFNHPPKPSEPSQPFRLRHLISGDWWLWCAAWLLGALTVVSVLGLAMTSGWFLTMTATAGLLAAGAHIFNYMVPAALIRTLAIFRTLGRYGELQVSHYAVFGLLKSLRVRFFQRWASLSFLERQADEQSSAQKMHRLVKDIDVLNEFSLRLLSPALMALMATGMMSVVLVLILPQAWLVLGFLWLAPLVVGAALKLGVPMAQTEAALTEQRKSQLLDTLPALTQLLIWRRWQQSVDELLFLDERQQALMVKAWAVRRLTAFVIQLCIALAVVCVLWVAADVFTQALPVFTLQNINESHAISSALVLALVLGLLGLAEFIQNLAAEPLALGRSVVAKQRLNALIAHTHNTTAKTAIHQFCDDLTIELDCVSVKAPKAVLGTQQISAQIDSCSPCLLLGASGAGKSTLLQTLAQEYAVHTGAIWLGRAQKTAWQSIDFMDSLGFLGQTVDIFDQTLADNLRLGKPNASDDELKAALQKVNLLEWFNALPKGWQTPLGEYGAAISGGQARRIALARLLLSPKKVLLLDEPFAGLDIQTRQVVWQSLLDAQKSKQIGLLLISTHQLWDEMQNCQLLHIEAQATSATA